MRHPIYLLAATAFASTTGIGAARAAELFPGQDRPANPAVVAPGVSTATVPVAMKNTGPEVTLGTKSFTFTAPNGSWFARQDSVPAETSTDDGRTWRSSANTAQGCELHDQAATMTCSNSTTTRWEKGTILRFNPRIEVDVNADGPLAGGRLVMGFTTSGWSAKRYETPPMTMNVRAESTAHGFPVSEPFALRNKATGGCLANWPTEPGSVYSVLGTKPCTNSSTVLWTSNHEELLRSADTEYCLHSVNPEFLQTDDCPGDNPRPEFRWRTDSTKYVFAQVDEGTARCVTVDEKGDITQTESTAAAGSKEARQVWEVVRQSTLPN